MRTMQRSKEEIIKDEKLAGAVQVLPNDGLFAVEVSNFKYFDFQGGFEGNWPKKECSVSIRFLDRISKQQRSKIRIVKLALSIKIEKHIYRSCLR